MAEVFADFDGLVTANGREFTARVCGAPIGDHGWQGWIEFTALDDGEVYRTPRETTQPNRATFEHWVTGLTPTYLEGALDRALSPRPVVMVDLPEESAYDEPAPAVERVTVPPVVPPADAILDPFSVYQNRGEASLRRQLHALASRHLVNIIRAHALSDLDAATLEATPKEVLIDLIVTATRAESER
jgi:hypothetical protein